MDSNISGGVEPQPEVIEFAFVQSSALATWVIVHNLGLSPAVVVQDSTNTQVFVETVFTNSNTVTLNFAAPESGMATCIG
jgi:hypothetical protein